MYVNFVSLILSFPLTLIGAYFFGLEGIMASYIATLYLLALPSFAEAVL